MNESQLNKALLTIGKESFVTFFAQLSDFNQTDEAVAEFIASGLSSARKEVVTSQSALTWRVKPARRIIKAGQSGAAMLLISRSTRLPNHITLAAADMAKSLGVAE